MRSAVEAAAAVFRSWLEKASPEGPVARYLVRRGIEPAAVEALGLGYAPPEGGLIPILRRKGIGIQDLEEAGLVVRRDGGRMVERFRNRLIFPIFDVLGRVVGFGGRILGDGEPKYLNSPETPIFQKRSLLYGLNWSKDAVKKAGEAVLVEGYMDYLALHQAGVTHAAATLGTALTEVQARLLKRYADTVILNFDRDAAGLNAARRAVHVLLGEGLRIRVMLLPSGKDPDDFIKAEGAEAYRKEVGAAKPFFTFLAEQAQEGAALHTVEGDMKVLTELEDFLRAVPDPVERETHARDLAGRLRMDPRALIRRLGRERTRPSSGEEASPAGKGVALPPNQQMLIRGILRHPEERETLRTLLSEETLRAMKAGPLVENLLHGRVADGPEQTLMMAYVKHNCHDAPTLESTLAAAASIRSEYLLRKERRIQQQIREASREGDMDLIRILNREKMAVIKERQALAAPLTTKTGAME